MGAATGRTFQRGDIGIEIAGKRDRINAIARDSSDSFQGLGVSAGGNDAFGSQSTSEKYCRRPEIAGGPDNHAGFAWTESAPGQAAKRKPRRPHAARES